MELQFNIGRIHTNGVEGSSSINIGYNILFGIQSASKSTTGNSNVNGDSAWMPSLASHVDDRDLLDTPSWIDAPLPPWQ